MTTKTSDGYVWEPTTGLRAGLESDAVVKPARSLAGGNKVYDAIVIGAGYAGLAAARDLSLLSALQMPLCRGWLSATNARLAAR